jgi:hypothetical protein
VIKFKYDQEELKELAVVRRDNNFRSFALNLKNFGGKLREYKALESVKTALVGSATQTRAESATNLHKYLKKWWDKVKITTESLKERTFKTAWEDDIGLWPELKGMPKIHAGGGKAPNRLALRKTNNKYSFKNKKSKKFVAKIKYKHSLRKHGKKKNRLAVGKRTRSKKSQR